MRRILLLALLMASTPTAPLRSETLVAVTTIRGATAIAAADLAILPEVTPGALSDPGQAIGMEARVNLYPGRPIRAADLRPAAVIERNEIVTLRFNARGLSHCDGGSRARPRGRGGTVARDQPVLACHRGGAGAGSGRRAGWGPAVRGVVVLLIGVTAMTAGCARLERVGQLPQLTTPTRGNEVFAMTARPLPKRAWPRRGISPPPSGPPAANRSSVIAAPASGAIS
jgi:flagella basal body P-ring formation protein FlgA